MARPTPDLERLAAMLDGRLSDAERAEVIAQAAASEDASAILADAAAVVRELGLAEADVAGGTSSRPRVVPLISRRTNRWWVAIAAAIVVAVALPALWLARGRGPGDPLGAVAEQLRADGVALPADWSPPPWTVVRGEAPALSESARAVRLGVSLVDLEVAARHDAPRAGRIAVTVAQLLDGIPGSPPVVQLYGDIARGAAPSGERLARGRGAVRSLVDPRTLDVAGWLEAVRLAASSGDTAFLRRLTVPPALARPSAALPDSVIGPLEQLGAGGAPRPLDLPRISAAARAALGELGS